MKKVLTLAVFLLSCSFFFPPPITAQGKKMSLSPMVGGYYYDRENETFSDYTLGLAYNFQASPDLGLEARLLYAPVGGGSTYYFITGGPRYTFLNADFFMAPSVEIHGGVLIPQGDKKDIDGVAGIGAMLLYKTRWDVEFGPEVRLTPFSRGRSSVSGRAICSWLR